jgi:hypothetical protein
MTPAPGDWGRCIGLLSKEGICPVRSIKFALHFLCGFRMVINDFEAIVGGRFVGIHLILIIFPLSSTNIDQVFKDDCPIDSPLQKNNFKGFFFHSVAIIRDPLKI